jgi:hypothetical protein
MNAANERFDPTSRNGKTCWQMRQVHIRNEFG